MRFRRRVRQLRELTRWRDWADSKIPPLLAALGLAGLPLAGEGWPLLVRMLLLLGAIALLAVFGHVVNDLADRRADLVAGKAKIMHRLPAVVPLLAAGAGAAGSLTLVAWAFDPAVLALMIATLVLAAAYSLPPRLKERGWLGWAASALAQRGLPTALIFLAFDAWTPPAVLLVLLNTQVGLRFIVVHQLLDRENDLQSGLSTPGTRGSAPMLELLLRRVFYPAEILLLVGFAAALAVTYPGWPTFLVVGIESLAIALAVLRHRLAPPTSYQALAPLHILGLPIGLTLLLSLRNPVFLPLLALVLTLGLREGRALLTGNRRAAPGSSPAVGGPAAALTRLRGQALSRGLRALTGMQAADGSFPLRRRLQVPWWRRGARWQPCGPLFSTAYVLLAAGALLPADSRQAALDYLRRARRGDGLWDYDPALDIPPDSDCTACALAALALHDQAGADPAGPALLRAFWRAPEGPFRSWPDSGMWSLPERDDAVVNCNVIHALKLLGTTPTPAETAAAQRLIAGSGEGSRYYCAPSTVAHAARRAGFAWEDLPAGLHRPPKTSDAAAIAQHLAAQPKQDPVLVGALLALQRPDGSWPAAPWVRAVGKPTPLWGSAAVSTALALEALAREQTPRG